MKYIVIFSMVSIYILEYKTSPVFHLVELSEKQSDKLSHKLGDKLTENLSNKLSDKPKDKQSIHTISAEERRGKGEKRFC